MLYRRSVPLVAALVLFGTIWMAGAGSAMAAVTHRIQLPHQGSGLDFDDMTYAPSLHRVLVPAAQSGALALINPARQTLGEWRHIVPSGQGADHDDAGTTSADSGDGLVFASDHKDEAIVAVNPHGGQVVARAKLASGPDIIRYVKPLDQVWVTEPETHEIQRFKATAGAHPSLRLLGAISLPKGSPELLAVDAAHYAVYANQRPATTLKISLRSLQVVASWPNSCQRDQGLALAPARNLLFVGCREGKVVALDTAQNGKEVSHAAVGAGVDLIAWNPHLQHLYAPGARSATLSVLKLTAHDQLQKVATVPTAKHAHCVATDDQNHAYVCDPRHAAIIVYRDHKTD
ncbi:YncE family protein [Salinisphaera sp. LB1]|uniref:YncE family protein n=1 Tax=Salinisphaera sp. LB1 TaxID=2183911 RepID=UPI000D705B9F|nr:hypothetical protein [Salinisphaera sp. LB1]